MKLIGKRFNKLMVVSKAPPSPSGKPRWNCVCDCGGTTISDEHYLVHHQVGCKNCSTGGNTHNLSHHKEHSIWAAMKQRCFNPNCDAYENYGGRGISVCVRWTDKDNGYVNFLSDMGFRPTKDHTIERIDNNGNYEPSNCKWATRKEQARNFRHNRIIELDGVKKCLSEWCEIYGTVHDPVSRRIKRGWDIKKAITTPIAPKAYKQKLL